MMKPLTTALQPPRDGIVIGKPRPRPWPSTNMPGINAPDFVGTPWSLDRKVPVAEMRVTSADRVQQVAHLPDVVPFSRYLLEPVVFRGPGGASECSR